MLQRLEERERRDPIMWKLFIPIVRRVCVYIFFEERERERWRVFAELR